MPQNTLSRGNLLYQFVIAPSLTPVSVASSTTAEQSFTVSGLQISDLVDVNYFGTSASVPAAQIAGVGIVNCRVSGANTLQIGFANATAAAVTPSAGVYTIIVSRPEEPISLLQTTAG
jgi:hypothetical protein